MNGILSLRTPYSRCLAVLALCYAIIYGWLLARTGGMPYVMDNNETFSALWHASNLLDFGAGKTFGLADESYGLTAASHPYVYTHSGNFPRLFAMLLYVLGARSAEAQIVITTFTIGVAAVFLAYHFFARIANPRFALICCLLLITDYVLVAQWQVVTYRVWQEFFVFSSLLCVHGMERRGWLWPVLTVVNFALLAYYELVFVAFVALSTALYAGLRLRGTPLRLLKLWGLLGGGIAIGIAVLLGQLVLYLGWPGLREDAYLTFVARNRYQDAAALMERMQAFFESHHLVFWYNLANGHELRNIKYFLASFTYYDFQPHTPFFTTLCWIVLLGLAGHYALRYVPGRRGAGPAAPPAGGTSAGAVLAAALLYPIVLAFMIVLIGKTRIWGIHDQIKWFRPVPGLGLFCAMAAAAVVAALAAFPLQPGRTGLARLLPRRDRSGPMLAAAIFLFAVTALISKSEKIYNDRYVLFWLDILHSTVPEPIAYALTLLVTGLGLAFVLSRPALVDRVGLNALGRPLAHYLVAGIAAYSVVFVLAPGIVFNGFRFRLVPITVFHTQVLTAIVLYVLLTFGADRLAAARSRAQPGTPGERRRDAALAAGSLLAFGFLCYYWIGVQAAQVRLMPPDYLPVLDELAKPPYKGKTFIANTYAAPIAAKTGNWAYLHGSMVENELDVEGDRVSIPFDKRYIWFADRDSNPDYARPDYFICITIQSPYTVAARMATEEAGVDSAIGCQVHQMVILARDPGDKKVYPKLELTGIDTEGPGRVGYERWAIVKLDWSAGDPHKSGRPTGAPRDRSTFQQH
jgi:hypothetical protein